MNTPPKNESSIARGARGGNAIAGGQGSKAFGGNAGRGGIHPGGRGGDVEVCDPNVTAVGGRGGGGGVAPGMPGMDIVRDGMTGDYVEGGMGGEADQPDGRGGRGGRVAGYESLCRSLGREPRPHMKLPYWGDDEVEFGRGGDRPDTPRYRARRLIIEMLKAEHLNASRYFTTDVWYERDAVPVAFLNDRLAAAGHNWTVAIVDHEYEITDLTA